MTALALAASLLSFALFGLATDAHYGRRLGGRLDIARKRRMRFAAWFAIAAAFVFAIAARGWVFGPVLWLGLVMLGAGLVFLILNFAPTTPRPAARNWVTSLQKGHNNE